MSGQPRVAVRVTNSEGRLLNVGDLVPLVPSLQAMIEDIARREGTTIDPGSLALAAHRFPVFEIEGWSIACVLGCECTREKSATRWLQEAREISLKQAVIDISRDRWRAVDRFAKSPASARAAFVLTGVVETGILVARTGAMKRSLGDVVFDGRFDAGQGTPRLERQAAARNLSMRGTVH